MEGREQHLDLEKEYAKNVSLKRDMESLREWARQQDRYPEIPDYNLFLFLHSCYYNFENAKSCLKCYYEQRSNWTDVFRNRNPKVSPLKEQFEVVVNWPLKQSTKEGYKIMYTKLMDYNSSKFVTNDEFKLYFALFDLWLNEVGNAEGIVLVLDAEGLNWGHLPKLGINQARKLIAYVQEAFPIRLKGVELINLNPIIEKLFIICRMFMKKELYEMTHLHSSMQTVYQYVPRTALPKDYGGNDLTILEMHKKMLEMFDKHSGFFANEAVQEVKKQPGRFSFRWDAY